MTAASTAAGRDAGRLAVRDDRTVLRALDGCLQELEDANERGEVRVSSRLARRLERRVPWLIPGMLLADAIEGVFKQQESYLRCEADELAVAWSTGRRSRLRSGEGRAGRRHLGPEAGLVEPMTEAEARALTERIKTQMHHVCMLVLEAHQRRAWQALGYATWEGYIRHEFGLSRSRSYQLLDQGRVLLALQVALGVPGIPELSADAAGEIKFRLAEVIDEIRRRAVTAASADQVRRIVVEVVQMKRAQIAAARNGGGSGSRPRLPAAEPGDLGAGPAAGSLEVMGSSPPRALGEVVEFLAALPPPAEMLGRLSREERDRLTGLERAVRWLTDFAAEYAGRRSTA